MKLEKSSIWENMAGLFAVMTLIGLVGSIIAVIYSPGPACIAICLDDYPSDLILYGIKLEYVFAYMLFFGLILLYFSGYMMKRDTNTSNRSPVG